MKYQGFLLKIGISALWIILVLLTEVKAGDYFDCRREGQDCGNSKACVDTGIEAGYCDCGGTEFVAFDCGLEDALKDTGPCTSLSDHCGTDGGTCYDNSGTAACHCPQNQYGDQCENPRYAVVCSTSSMLIVLNPYETFGGVIYVDGQKATTGCSLTTADLPVGKQGLALDVLDTDCGGVTVNSATNKSRDVIVQFNPRFLTSVDSKVTVTCGEGTNSVDVQNEITTVRSTKQQNIDNTPDIDSAAVEFNIKLKDGTIASSNVPLDDLLTFEFIASPVIITCKYKLFPDSQGDANAYDGFENKADMQACQDFCDQTASCVAAQYTNTDCYLYTESQFSSLSSVSGTLYMEKVCESSGFDAIRLESCMASNKESAPDLEVLKIIENGCPSADLGKLLKQEPTRSPDTTITFQITPFSFNRNNVVLVACTVKVCPAGKGSFCDLVDCNGQSGTGRKRRSLTVSDERVTKRFTVQGASRPSNTETAESSSDECEPEVNLTTSIIAGVAMVTFLLLVICTVALMHLKKKSNRKLNNKLDSSADVDKPDVSPCCL